MFIYLHFLNFKIAEFLHRYIAKKIVGKKDEGAMKLKDNVHILLHTLKWHGIKHFATVKCLDYIGSY